MTLAGSNGEQAAAQNRATILSAIHRGAPVSRTELAKRSRLTKQAVTRIVDRLLDEGLVMEARRRKGLRGQPAIELEIDPKGVFSIGANIDRDHLNIVAVDATGAVRGRIHHEVRFLMPETFVELMEDALSSFFRRKVIQEARLAGIGLAIPDWLGEVPVIGKPVDYRRWSGFDMRGALARITHHPVLIDNDANAAALGEIEYGFGTEIRSFFYILVNACLGGSLVIDGVRHKGASGLGGEIGMIVDPEGVLIGGRLPVRMIDELLIYTHEEITRRGLSPPSLHRAASSDDAAALGAAAMPLAHRLGLPTAEATQRDRVPLSSADALPRVTAPSAAAGP